MNATVTSFRGLIDEMKAVSVGEKKPTIRSGKNSYESTAARAFEMKLTKKKGLATPSVKAIKAKAKPKTNLSRAP